MHFILITDFMEKIIDVCNVDYYIFFLLFDSGFVSFMSDLRLLSLHFINRNIHNNNRFDDFNYSCFWSNKRLDRVDSEIVCVCE